jgi:mono/diheme cytochrome c family protein
MVKSVPVVPTIALGMFLAAAGAVRVSADQPPSDAAKISPVELAKTTPKGKLANPYRDTQADIVAQGEALFQRYTCSGCHGPAGGGALCPPVTNEIWVYGGDDDTLFRLVALGSAELQTQGYTRIGHESIVAPMPPFGTAVQSSDDLWKILAFIRAHYSGDPARKFGTPAAQH